MRRRLATLTAGSIIAGAALLVSACGDDKAGDGVDAALDNGAFGNSADPSAIETIGNGGGGTAAPAGGAPGAPAPAPAPDAGAPTPSAPDAPTDNDDTDVGGDMGGNAAGGTANRM